MTRLAVSNIAWPQEEETAVADVLHAAGVHEVEIAPTKTFADPLRTSASERAEYLEFWRARDIGIVAFQSMLFGRPDLTLFDGEDVAAQTAGVLEEYIVLAAQLDARVLVFGSPKNRRVPAGMTATEADDRAVAFFRRLGARAEAEGVRFCIEPNPSVYDCNFVTTAAQGEALVRAVNSPGFGLHLDAAGMHLASDDAPAAIRASADVLRHFHASAPQLGALEAETVDHAAAAEALRGIDYRGTVSIEMRPGEPGDAPSRVRDAVALAARLYAEPEEAR